MLTLAQSSAFPEGGSIALGLALVAGITLWLFGAKLVKPVFLFLGLAIGGFVGATLLPYIDFIGTIRIAGFSLTPGILGLLVGGALGALISLAMFRMVITITAALAFAAAGLMGALLFLHFEQGNATPQASDPSPITQVETAENQDPSLVDRFREEVAEQYIDALASDDENVLTDETKQQIKDAAERSKAFIARVGRAITNDFQSRPSREKFVLLSSMFAGLGLGLLVGVTLPTRTAALVTSLFGSAVWMSSAVALMSVNGSPPAILDKPVVVYAAVWIIITILGLLAQLGFLSKAGALRSNRSDNQDDDED